jgi:hypothetical protein
MGRLLCFHYAFELRLYEKLFFVAVLYNFKKLCVKKDWPLNSFMVREYMVNRNIANHWLFSFAVMGNSRHIFS